MFSGRQAVVIKYGSSELATTRSVFSERQLLNWIVPRAGESCPRVVSDRSVRSQQSE